MLEHIFPLSCSVWNFVDFKLGHLGSNFVSLGVAVLFGNIVDSFQSKWLVAALFAGIILLRHDAEALWTAMGSVINAVLSIVLKRILNQERPIATLRSDPGMPSSHAQSIFFTVLFVALSGNFLTSLSNKRF